MRKKRDLNLGYRKGNISSVVIFFVFIIAFVFISFVVNAVVDLGFDEINDEIQNDDIFSAENKERIDDQYQNSKTLFDNIFVLVIVSLWVISIVFAANSFLPNMFFWVLVILSIIGLIIAFPLANTYDDMVSDGDFSEFPTKYPKTNHFFNNLHVYVLAYSVSMIMAGYGGGRI